MNRTLTPDQDQMIEAMIRHASTLKLSSVNDGSRLFHYILNKYDDGHKDTFHLAKRAVGRMQSSFKKLHAFDPTVQRTGGIRRIRIGEFDKHRGLKVSEQRYHKKMEKWVWIPKYWPTKKRIWNSAFLEFQSPELAGIVFYLPYLYPLCQAPSGTFFL